MHTTTNNHGVHLVRALFLDGTVDVHHHDLVGVGSRHGHLMGYQHDRLCP